MWRRSPRRGSFCRRRIGSPTRAYSYVVSFIGHHERVFTTPASRFMRELCHHYGEELHNFAPNAISQAATFVGVYEGFLRSP
jgi:hypothetical protein